MQLLPAGFDDKPYRQTGCTVFSVVEGQGIISIEHCGKTVVYQFNPRDHFVVSSWHTVRLHSQMGGALFSLSNRPVHQMLEIHKKERMT